MEPRDQSLLDELRKPYEPKPKSNTRLVVGLLLIALACYVAACPDLPKNETRERNEYSMAMD